jgi:serine/threonine protein phosphatase 1
MPSLPPNTRIYAIGDIHGRADLLDQIYERIEGDIGRDEPAGIEIVHLGDYVDRGPDSRGVIERIIAMSERHNVVTLKGNHEDILLRFFDNPESFRFWQRLGAVETLVSYGLGPQVLSRGDDFGALSAALHAALPETHKQFLSRLPLTYECGDFLFVHAGLRPGIPVNRQSAEDLMTIRDDFLHHTERFEKFVIHGHTPVRSPDIRSNRINIDTGAYATGQLTCLVIEGDKIRFL